MSHTRTGPAGPPPPPVATATPLVDEAPSSFKCRFLLRELMTLSTWSSNSIALAISPAVIRRSWGGGIAISPDATHPPAICQTWGGAVRARGGGGSAGGVCGGVLAARPELCDAQIFQIMLKLRGSTMLRPNHEFFCPVALSPGFRNWVESQGCVCVFAGMGV